MSGDYEFTVGTVQQGTSFTVTVDDAPCAEVVIEFRVDGALIESRPCGVPGSEDFECPAGSDGRTWSIVVRCSGDTGKSETGTVQP
jgi:hypothetical protein